MKRVLILGIVLAILLGIFILRGYMRGRDVVSIFSELMTDSWSDRHTDVVRYDLISGALVISRDKLSGAGGGFGIEEKDLYHQLEYEFKIPVYDDADFSQEWVSTASWYIEGFSASSEQGVLKLIIHKRRIAAFVVTGDARNIYIKPVHPNERHSKILLLDPGHGDHDTGAVSARGIVKWGDNDRIEEKDFNLLLAQKVEALFKGSDIKVYLTRAEDVFIPLEDRRKMRDDLADIFVSIHANASDYPSKSGLWTYYAANATPLGYTSAMFSLDMLYAMAEATGCPSHDVDSANFAVLRGAKIPATLVEVGFLTNTDDLIKLASEEYQDKLAEAIYKGILEGFERADGRLAI